MCGVVDTVGATATTTKKKRRADASALDAATADASLTSRLRQLRALRQSQQAAIARSAATAAAESSQRQTDSQYVSEEDSTSLAAMIAHSAASLSRFRGYSTHSLSHTHAHSSQRSHGDDVVASETQKATAKIEADKKKDEASAMKASRVRQGKEKYVVAGRVCSVLVCVVVYTHLG